MSRKHIAIIGATSAIAEHCARLWVEREPLTLTLIGRDEEKLRRIAADLKARSPASEIATHAQADLTSAAAIAQCVASLQTPAPPDVALVAFGLLPDQATCEQNLQANADAQWINGVAPALYAEALANAMQQAGRGAVAVIGSVAGDRGRKSNYVYGAAKGLVARYMQGLQHRLALQKSPVRAVLIKPGPTDTPMTAHLKTGTGRASMAAPEEVARCIVRGIDRGRAVVYAPGKWALIMLIVRCLPDFVFRRINL